MSDVLTLTSYFGERERTKHALLVDELLARCAAHQIHSSVLLRGIAGFGKLHHLQTDRLLTLSDDLPAIVVAVDTPPRIEGLLDAVLPLKRRGLVTLERARLLGDHSAGAGAKLTAYVGRSERAGGMPAFVAVCNVLRAHELDGATTLLGVDGVTRGRRVRARLLGRNAEVPMMIVGVGAPGRVARAGAELAALLNDPLVVLEAARVCKRAGRVLATPHELPGTDEHGLPLWQKLVVHSSEGATHDGRPLHAEIVRRLRESGAAGVTCIRGVWGFQGDHPPHGDRMLQLRRHVPVMTVAIDAPDRSARSFQIIDELTVEHGLVTSEIVPAAHSVGAGGEIALARPPPP